MEQMIIDSRIAAKRSPMKKFLCLSLLTQKQQRMPAKFKRNPQMHPQIKMPESPSLFTL